MPVPVRLIIVSAALAVLSGTADAATLPANGSQVALPGTSVAAQPQLAGAIVRDVLTPFSYQITDDRCGEECTYRYDMTGTLQSRVVKAVDGTFDFYWRIKTQPITTRVIDSAPLPDVVEPTPPGFTADVSWAALAGFNASAYRADWRSDGLGSAAPRTAALAADGPIFYFSDRHLFADGESIVVENSTLKSGGESRFFFLDTDARNYASGATMQLHSELSGPFVGPAGVAYFSSDEPRLTTFAPAPIPEPETWALMLAGLALLVGARRRARANGSA